MRGAALWPPCSCFQSPEIYGEKNDTRTACQGLSEKGRGGRGGRGGGVVQIQMNNSTMRQPLAFWIQHYHFTKCFYFGILFIYLLFLEGGRGWWRKNIVEVAGQIRNLKHWWGSLFETGRFSEQINSPDLISNSPYCLPYSSCDVSLENLVLDQLIIP